MPYIKPELRPEIEKELAPLMEFLEKKAKSGEYDQKILAAVLTYIIFKFLRKFYEEGKWYDKSDAEKVVNSAIDEFKRRFLHPYEDKKIQENGDVF